MRPCTCAGGGFLRPGDHRYVLYPEKIEEYQGVQAPKVEAHVTGDGGEALDA